MSINGIFVRRLAVGCSAILLTISALGGEVRADPAVERPLPVETSPFHQGELRDRLEETLFQPTSESQEVEEIEEVDLEQEVFSPQEGLCQFEALGRRWRIPYSQRWFEVAPEHRRLSAEEGNLTQLQTDVDGNGHFSSLFAQSYPAKGRSLEAYWYSLRYVIVTAMEGRVLKRDTFTWEGVPGMVVYYEGKALGHSGLTKKFARIVLQDGDEILVFHGVAYKEGYSELLEDMREMRRTLLAEKI